MVRKAYGPSSARQIRCLLPSHSSFVRFTRKRGVNSRLYAVPAVFIMTLTISAMVFQITRDLAAGHYLVGLVGLAIAVVTLWIALEAALAWRRRPESNHASESLSNENSHHV